MGAVYLAERDDVQPVKPVAVKILRHAIGAPHAIARFRDERRILAALEHPHIVRWLDAGNTEEGLPYFVMEYLAGQPITTFARARALSIRARVHLVHDVCAAIQHAHQNLVIHRDIKPSNILVDEEGTPKLLDFGIAKLLAPVPGLERDARTRTGHMLFTPEYASPEQARGDAVSTATDVYSIGAVLYELVTDEPPHRTTGGVLETLRLIADVEPARPSSVAPAERRLEIAGDLDNIILKALRKEPARRYGTIEQLAHDLGRFLDGLPVRARATTRRYRARKFAGRHRAGVLVAVLGAVALAANLTITWFRTARTDIQAGRRSEAAASTPAEETRVLNEAARARAELDRVPGPELQIRPQLEQRKGCLPDGESEMATASTDRPLRGRAMGSVSPSER